MVSICFVLSLVRLDQLLVRATATQTVQPDTQITEPVSIESNVTEPVVTEPEITEPVVTEPVITEPVDTVPVIAEPVVTDPVTTESATTEPISTAPIATESVNIEIPETEPLLTEPVSITEDDVKIENKKILREAVPDASIQDGDLQTVSGQGIMFRLFNYGTNINKSAGNTQWRAISPYFTFRNSKMESGSDAANFNIPNPSVNTDHDQDGYTKSHATVERVLNGGYPVLDLSRNADGSGRIDPGISKTARDLRYLFSAGDHAVSAYAPTNTILQQSGSHYWYNSAEHAVDFDVEDNRFRLRNYVERNETTAGYGAGFGDFLPFTYTGGVQLDVTEDGAPYHVDTEDTDYWFGMAMQVNFLQSKAGRLGDQNMIFRFSGDDDVWVFVDDVLILDLGGTHGTVSGSINFATGEVLQYLSWGGVNGTEDERKSGSNTSFPTTIRACFDAAERTPNGGWSKDGRTFADFSEHTLKFFYLERGAAVANCSLDFRLPTLPDESLTVTKDLTADGDAAVRDFVADSIQYRFRVMKADEAGIATDEPFLTAGMTYSLLENGVKTGTGTVGEDNCFLLRSGQSAQFTQMLQKGNGATKYVVEELIPDELTGQYAGVEYLVSGAGGETITENNPAEPFTRFQTDILSADQTQSVTFRNRVDTATLGTLKITKRAAAGTQIPEDLYFQIQVKLSGNLLPVGTVYKVGEESRTVETAGVLMLRVNETAVIERGVLSGTSYQVTELSASFDGYRPTYTGVVQPFAEMVCNEEGVSGEFPLASTVHITITNADYDFAVEIPVRKTVLDFQESATFDFVIEQVEKTTDGWSVLKALPEMKITVAENETAQKVLTIGYRSSEDGVYYYRIREITGSGNFLYDTAVFLVEVTVADGRAEVTRIQRNGKDVEVVSFVNRCMTSLTVTKTIEGGTGSVQFPFTVEIFLNGSPFVIPETGSNLNYKAEGNTLSFSLRHGESITLPVIPMHAVVSVEEHDYAGFQVFTELGGSEESKASGAVREIQFDEKPQTIHYTNKSGFRLPNTGGMGTFSHIAAGTVISLGTSAAFLHTQFPKRKEEDIPPDA